MKTEQLYNKSEYCCGCSACKNVCKQNAITMKENSFGFTFPEIDENLCVDCGLCKSVCNFQKENKKQNAPQAVYAGKTKTTDIKKSASGGIFACLADSVIKNGGTVFGAASVNDGGIRIKHIKADSKTGLLPLLGSKYVQSDIADAYFQAESELKAGKTVLFSGTPCQIDGLYGYLKKDYDNLFTADLICHGVPSQKMFTDYLKTLEKKSRPTAYQFRTKEIGGEMTSKITFENGKTKYIPCNMSSYFYSFINGYTYRDCCYACPYAKKERVGDITLGDFWGIEKHHPEFNKDGGVSCILVNTEKGENLFEQNKNNMELQNSDFEKAAENNAQLKEPSKTPPERNDLFSAYQENGYGAVEQYYEHIAGTKRYLSGLKLTAKKILKR